MHWWGCFADLGRGLCGNSNAVRTPHAGQDLKVPELLLPRQQGLRGHGGCRNLSACCYMLFLGGGGSTS